MAPEQYGRVGMRYPAHLQQEEMTMGGFMRYRQTCQKCGGEGKVVKDPCTVCNDAAAVVDDDDDDRNAYKYMHT